MHNRLKNFSFLHAVAFLTWAVVAVTSLFFVSHPSETSSPEILLAGCLFVIFIITWLLATEDTQVSDKKMYIYLVVQWGCFTTLFFLLPNAYVVILSILWSAVVAYLVSLHRALIISIVAIYVPFTLIYSLHWGHSWVFINAILFFTFNIFVIVTLQVSEKEKQARELAELLNAELTATQKILQQTSEQTERIRIARNIHDLLGHHLTALTIKLQYASHKTDMETKATIDECLQISRLLLSDVREAVSDMRELQPIDLYKTLNEMIATTPRLKIDLSMQTDINTPDPAVAQCIVRSVQESITNTLKHSRADKMTIQVTSDATHITLILEDNGAATKDYTEGNGLTGMRERLAQIGGQTNFEITQTGFKTHLRFPLEVS
ncbi:hypothetical protein DRW07_01470 [Alteromonas sediminis]|uniref:Signal transduction histidine kinase subgroup 3 dimerisation and phosphoacceptor domain-containing protein n=1 Tax=Alteromonas sediminis TaxID=2259342 RepID=A0A3N5Y9T7_9ALTE|nr:histidine kinase [Alteromonas sediminis]RPJ68109.1 hypothetical protein DRW07_01470 [Alteromonas sediminis]